MDTRRVGKGLLISGGVVMLLAVLFFFGAIGNSGDQCEGQPAGCAVGLIFVMIFLLVLALGILIVGAVLAIAGGATWAVAAHRRKQEEEAEEGPSGDDQSTR